MVRRCSTQYLRYETALYVAIEYKIHSRSSHATSLQANMISPSVLRAFLRHNSHELLTITEFVVITIVWTKTLLIIDSLTKLAFNFVWDQKLEPYKGITKAKQSEENTNDINQDLPKHLKIQNVLYRGNGTHLMYIK